LNGAKKFFPNFCRASPAGFWLAGGSCPASRSV